MWLMRNDIDDEFRIASQEVGRQYIASNKESVEDDICKIIKDASLCGYFEESIKRFEYTCKCFDKGNEYYEPDRISNAS